MARKRRSELIAGKSDRLYLRFAAFSDLEEHRCLVLVFIDQPFTVDKDIGKPLFEVQFGDYFSIHIDVGLCDRVFDFEPYFFLDGSRGHSLVALDPYLVDGRCFVDLELNDDGGFVIASRQGVFVDIIKKIQGEQFTLHLAKQLIGEGIADIGA